MKSFHIKESKKKREILHNKEYINYACAFPRFLIKKQQKTYRKIAIASGLQAPSFSNSEAEKDGKATVNFIQKFFSEASSAI